MIINTVNCVTTVLGNHTVIVNYWEHKGRREIVRERRREERNSEGEKERVER